MYLIYGSEAYKKRGLKENLKKLIADEGSINYSYFEGKDISLSEVYDVAVQLPFFAPRRLVIVENSGLFKAKKKKDGSGSAAEKNELSASERMLAQIFDDLPETTCLAFIEDEVTKTLKAYRTVNKNGTVIECGEDTREDVIKWLAKGFAQAGKQIRRSTAELLVDRVGISYDRLRLEYEKIVAYSGDRGYITDEDILAVTEEDIESRIFELLSFMCAGNRKAALDRYSALIANHEHPLYILAMIKLQFRQMLLCADLFSQGMNDYQTASKLGKNPYAIKKTRENVRYFPAGSVEKVLDMISDTDMKIKTGLLDEQIGIELLITEVLNMSTGAKTNQMPAACGGVFHLVRVRR